MASKRRKKRKLEERRSWNRKKSLQTNRPDSHPSTGFTKEFVDLSEDTLKDSKLRAAERLKKTFGDRNVIIGKSPVPYKLSEAVLELVRPFLDDDDEFEVMRNKILMGITAWNASLGPPQEQDKWLRSLLPNLPEVLFPSFRHEFVQLIKRKQKLYPKDERFITDWEITDQGDGLNFIVTHLVDPEQIED